MRILIDSMIALMLLGIVGGVVFYHRAASSELEGQRFVRQSLARLQEQAVYRGAIESEINDNKHQRYARIVRPEWFGDTLPVNVLVGGNHPWIDIAPPGDLGEHPPDPVCDGQEQAGFWYNPNLGVFRARVPWQATERETLDLYNHLNGTALANVMGATDPARTPIALAPSDLTAAHASPKPPTDHVYTAPPTADAASSSHGWSPQDPLPTAEDEASQPTQRARPTLRNVE